MSAILWAMGWNFFRGEAVKKPLLFSNTGAAALAYVSLVYATGRCEYVRNLPGADHLFGHPENIPFYFFSVGVQAILLIVLPTFMLTASLLMRNRPLGRILTLCNNAFIAFISVLGAAEWVQAPSAGYRDMDFLYSVALFLVSVSVLGLALSIARAWKTGFDWTYKM